MSRGGLVPPHANSGGTSPHDFLDEVTRELREIYSALAEDRARIAALEDLERLCVALAADLRRPLTVFDVIRSAGDRSERDRRLGLVRELRRPQGDPS